MINDDYSIPNLMGNHNPFHGSSHHQPDPMVFLWFSHAFPMLFPWFSMLGSSDSRLRLVFLNDLQSSDPLPPGKHRDRRSLDMMTFLWKLYSYGPFLLVNVG